MAEQVETDILRVQSALQLQQKQLNSLAGKADAKDAKGEENKEGKEHADKEKKTELLRYLFVSTRFNQDLIPKPELEPVPAEPAKKLEPVIRQVFVGRRINQPDAWQMPQGGVDKGELDAAIRPLMPASCPAS